MTAVGAESVEFEPVGGNRKAVLGRDFLLKSFDIAVFKFHDLATACADEMVVMALMGHVVILGLCSKVSSLSQPRFAEQVEGPVDGGEPKMRIFACQLMVHFLSRDVFLFQKGVEDQLTLARKFELVFLKMLFQNSHFLGMFGHRGRSLLPWRGIKDEMKQWVKSLSLTDQQASGSPLTAALVAVYSEALACLVRMQ
jgi:hypothetical protein